MFSELKNKLAQDREIFKNDQNVLEFIEHMFRSLNQIELAYGGGK